MLFQSIKEANTTVTFENIVVDVAWFIDTYIFSVIKIYLLLAIISLLIVWLSKLWGTQNITAISALSLFLDIIVSLLKISLSVAIMCLVFFYDFEQKIYIFEFPKEMLLSSIFVGILAFFEALAALTDCADAFLKWYKRDFPKWKQCSAHRCV